MKPINEEKFYIYLRKSTEGEDRQVQSIDRQADEVERLVKSRFLNVIEVFQESRSAMIPANRPEFSKMIKGIKSGKANGIICWHINRLARNPLESGIVQQLLEDGKIKRIITKDRDYTAADNAIIFSVESSLATQYSKDLGKMVKSGMEKKVNQGIFPLKAPIGYLNTKMAEHGSNYIIKDPDRFEVIRIIWEMILSEQYSVNQILNYVTNNISMRPAAPKNKSGKFGLSWLYHMFQNPFYAGLFRYNGQLYSGKHEAIVSLEEFDKVQRILGREGRPRKQKHFFAYTGLMTCEECGCAITATKKSKFVKSENKTHDYVYYYCSQRKRGVSCLSRKILTEQELEEQIIQQLDNVTLSENFVKVAIAIINSDSESDRIQQEKIKEIQKRELQSIEREIKNLLQVRLSELISDEEYCQEKTTRENKKMMLTQKIDQAKSSPLFISKEIEDKFSTLKNLKERFLYATPEERRKLFSGIGENCMLFGEKLNISKPDWLEVLQKEKQKAEAEIAWLELETYIDLESFSTHFRDVFPMMCALLDDVRTKLQGKESTTITIPKSQMM